MRHGGLLAVAMVALAGCSGDDGDGSATVSVGEERERRDSGRAGAPAVTEEDSGTPAVDYRKCSNVELVQFPAEDGDLGELVTRTTDPPDFGITRQQMEWDADCSDPTAVITLSGGSCVSPSAHALVIELSAEAISTRELVLGQNAVTEDADKGVVIHYTRPNSAAEPRGEWGNCMAIEDEDNLGLLDFRARPELRAGTSIQARFQLLLPACDGQDNPPQSLSGAFNVTLSEDASDACGSP